MSNFEKRFINLLGTNFPVKDCTPQLVEKVEDEVEKEVEEIDKQSQEPSDDRLSPNIISSPYQPIESSNEEKEDSGTESAVNENIQTANESEACSLTSASNTVPTDSVEIESNLLQLRIGNDANENASLSTDHFQSDIVSPTNHTDTSDQNQNLQIQEVNDETENVPSFQAVSPPLNILEYAKEEWKGNTYKAKLMLEGYNELVKRFNSSYLRRIRGDNYCALRSVVFHLLTQANEVVLFRSKTNDSSAYIKNVIHRLVNELNCINLLNQWNFANRVSFSTEDRLQVAHKCVDCLADQLTEFGNIESDAERHEAAANLMNNGSITEIYLFEAVKLMMLETAVRAHNSNIKGEDVPTYVWLLFARDSSENPETLLINHLNVAGDTAGLEQVS